MYVSTMESRIEKSGIKPTRTKKRVRGVPILWDFTIQMD